MNAACRRVLLLSALAFAALPAFFVVVRGGAAQGPPTAKTGKLQHFTGKVVFLEDLLKKVGSRLDPAAAPHWMALVTEDGKIYPLIKDDGSKMFFTDKRTRNRKMKLTGRLFAGTHLLQVVNVHSFKNGKLHEIYYWCDICAIRRNAGGICECCGDPMELRERPQAR